VGQDQVEKGCDWVGQLKNGWMGQLRVFDWVGQSKSDWMGQLVGDSWL
jgi:hypothetical protein